MGAVTTLAVTVAAAVGMVSLYRFVERHKRDIEEILSGEKDQKNPGDQVIDYERDPESGVFKPKH